MQQAMTASRWADSVRLIGLLWLLLVVASVLAPGGSAQAALPRNVPGQLGLLLILIGLGAFLWPYRGRLFHTVTSASFGVGLLSVLALATILGTMIVQGSPAPLYSQRYGSVLGGAFLALGIDDLFRSLWFNGLLAFLALSLTLTIIRRRAWQLRTFGLFLSHAGVITVILGGLWGNVGGFKGDMDLHVGRSSSTAVARPGPSDPGRTMELGFAVRLDKFDIEQYADRYRMYVFRKEGEDYRPTVSFDPTKLSDWTPTGVGDLSFRVTRTFPDFYLEPVLTEIPEGKPALEIREAGSHAPPAQIVLDGSSEPAVPLDSGKLAVRFFWESPSRAELLSPRSADVHRILLRRADGSDAGNWKIEPKPGLEIQAGPMSARVVEYYPDFIYDPATRTASTRSDKPLNPALQLALRPPGGGQETTRWLFAKMPEFDHEGAGNEGPRFVYRFESRVTSAERELVVIGSKAEILVIEGGKLAARARLPENGIVSGGDGLPAWVPELSFKIFRSAERQMVPRTKSQEWANPALEVDLRDGPIPQHIGEIMTSSDGGSSIALVGRDAFLVFQPKSDDIKAFRSTLTILEDGRSVLQKTIAVNSPLTYGGFTFYQSNYRREDPTYSGLQVVGDPGVPLVYLGFVMVVMGAIGVFYVQPALARRRAP